MTWDTCFAHCASNNQRYAGLQYASQCFCGDSDDDYAMYGAASESDCSTPCSGNSAEVCGGGWRLSVFELGKVLKISAMKMIILLVIILFPHDGC